MTVNELSIILFSLFEIVALIAIIRLSVYRRVNFLPCFLWPAVLLVPFFGFVAYVFLHEEPEGHPYVTGDSGWDVGGGGHSGGDSESGHGGN